MAEELGGMFAGKSKPDYKTGYALYQNGLRFNESINLNETVKVNENYYVGKQWEGVQANGLPTPVFNFLKRVVGFIVASITTDNIKVTATPLAATPATDELVTPARIANEEFEAIRERNRVPSLIREFARNAAVDGDGCMYTYWDADMETGQKAKGGIVTECIQNNRVFFGDPNDRRVQKQPWIIISSREFVRTARRRAKENDVEEWDAITPDRDDRDIDPEKENVDFEKVTTLLMFWRNEEDGHIWAYEFCRNATIKDSWDTGLKLYPITWLCWDFVQDSYHGQAMITGLIPNQIFVNKTWALSMVSLMRTAYPKFAYDNTRIKHLDNRVGAAIGIPGGDITNAIKAIDPPSISPQVSQFIEMAINQTEESLGATSVALGDTRPDNTSAIIALQRAASTPTEITKQNLYQSIEDLFRIYLDFMGEYYGKRFVDMEPPDELKQAYTFAGQEAPLEVPMEFDFKLFKKHPMLLNLDVGASSFYSEIAATQTLDNLLMNGHIDIVQYLERVPDSNIPARRALIQDIEAKRQMQAAAAPDMGGAPMTEPGELPPEPGDINANDNNMMEVKGGKGFGALQRKVLQDGTTAGLV